MANNGYIGTTENRLPKRDQFWSDSDDYGGNW